MLGMELSNFWIRRVCGWFQIVNASFILSGMAGPVRPIFWGRVETTERNRIDVFLARLVWTARRQATLWSLMYVLVGKEARCMMFFRGMLTVSYRYLHVFFMSIWNIHIYPHYVPLYTNMILYAKCSMFVYWLGFCHHATCITCHVSRSWKKIQSLLQLVPSSLVGWVTLRWWEHLQDNLCFS